MQTTCVTLRAVCQQLSPPAPSPNIGTLLCIGPALFCEPDAAGAARGLAQTVPTGGKWWDPRLSLPAHVSLGTPDTGKMNKARPTWGNLRT